MALLKIPVTGGYWFLVTFTQKADSDTAPLALHLPRIPRAAAPRGAARMPRSPYLLALRWCLTPPHAWEERPLLLGLLRQQHQVDVAAVPFEPQALRKGNTSTRT